MMAGIISPENNSVETIELFSPLSFAFLPGLDSFGEFLFGLLLNSNVFSPVFRKCSIRAMISSFDPVTAIPFFLQKFCNSSFNQ